MASLQQETTLPANVLEQLQGQESRPASRPRRPGPVAVEPSTDDIVFTPGESRRAFTMRIPEPLAIEIERVVMRDKANRADKTGHKSITIFAERALRYYLASL